MNLSKTIFLRFEFLQRLNNFFRLTFSCSFSTLSRWLLILINQFIFTFASAITFRKLSIKQNNISQCSSGSKFQHFFPSHAKLHPISSENLQTPPLMQNLFFASNPFGIKLKDLHISRNLIW